MTMRSLRRVLASSGARDMVTHVPTRAAVASDDLGLRTAGPHSSTNRNRRFDSCRGHGPEAEQRDQGPSDSRQRYMPYRGSASITLRGTSVGMILSS